MGSNPTGGSSYFLSPLAQLVVASGSGPEGSRFESLGESRGFVTWRYSLTVKRTSHKRFLVVRFPLSLLSSFDRSHVVSTVADVETLGDHIVDSILN